MSCSHLCDCPRCRDYVEELEDEVIALRHEILALSAKVQAYDRWLSEGVYFTNEEYKKEVAGWQLMIDKARGLV